MTVSSVHTKNRRVVGAVLGLITIAASIVVATPPASATSYDGVLGVKGASSGPYAGTDETGIDIAGIVSLAVAPGGTAAFPLEVLNNGSAVAQYAVNFAQSYPTTAKLMLGSTDVTSFANGFPGFVTTALAPGKTQTLSLKVTMPSTAQPEDQYNLTVNLYKPDGSVFLGSVRVFVGIKTTTGATGHDLFVTTSGQQSVRAGLEAAATIKLNGTATFTLKLQNDSATPQSISLAAFTGFPCSDSSFLATFTVGSSTITGDVFASNYSTPVLAKGKSTTVLLHVKSVSPHPPAGCANNKAYYLDAYNNSGATHIDLIVNAVR